MKVKEIGLCWIVVKDIQAAVKYYTEVVGLKIAEFNAEFGWAELEGHNGGIRLGIAQEDPKGPNECCPIQSGQNAVVTFSVDNLDEVKAEMLKKGARCEGDIIEVPGHVRMQTVMDNDGNYFQVCQLLHHSCCHC